MKDIYWSNSPDSEYEFVSKTTTPKDETKKEERPQVVFPAGPIRVENGSKTPKGKTKGPRKIKGQLKLPW